MYRSYLVHVYWYVCECFECFRDHTHYTVPKLVVMRRELNTYSRQSAMHHGVRARVLFRWSTGACILSSFVGASQQKRQQQQHHILESRRTCFSHIRTRNVSEGSLQQHPPPYSQGASLKSIPNQTPPPPPHSRLEVSVRQRLGGVTRAGILPTSVY